ncbi:MAG: hypothetical protein IKR04_06705 [Clostridia bacterium]|nr:hypothetical protein [Clostridia bacterium]
MKFRNPRATMTIEGRLPTKEDNFSEDRFYCDDIQNIFVRFDPYKDYIRVIFPGVFETELKIKYPIMEELAKTDATILDIIKAAYNVEHVTTVPTYGYSFFGEGLNYYIKFKDE